MSKSFKKIVVCGWLSLISVGFGCSDDPSQSSTTLPGSIQSTAEKLRTLVTPAIGGISQEAFLQASLNGNPAEVENFIRAQPDQIDATDPDGRTALMLACFNGHMSVAKRLLEAGAKVDAVDVTNRTALIYAASGSDLEVVQLLIDHKANINAVDNVQHWSPLMFAASEGQIKVVELLLEHGADHKAKDIDGEDCIDFARSRGHADVVWLLEQAKK